MVITITLNCRIQNLLGTQKIFCRIYNFFQIDFNTLKLFCGIFKVVSVKAAVHRVCLRAYYKFISIS